MWRDDFNVFKAAVKDLEELLIKATDHAIESVSDLADHTVLIESLQVRYALCATAFSAPSRCDMLPPTRAQHAWCATSLFLQPHCPWWHCF